MGSISFDVERFEQVAAGAGMVLLRVAGRWHADTAIELDQPELVVDDGAEEHRLPMLPAPGGAPLSADPSGVTWRGAFSARGELLQGGRTFALHAGGDVLVLPSPAPPSGTSGEAPPEPPRPGDEVREARVRAAVVEQAHSHAEKRIVSLERALSKEIGDRTSLERRAAAAFEARQAAETRAAEIEAAAAQELARLREAREDAERRADAGAAAEERLTAERQRLEKALGELTERAETEGAHSVVAVREAQEAVAEAQERAEEAVAAREGDRQRAEAAEQAVAEAAAVAKAAVDAERARTAEAAAEAQAAREAVEAAVARAASQASGTLSAERAGAEARASVLQSELERAEESSREDRGGS